MVSSVAESLFWVAVGACVVAQAAIVRSVAASRDGSAVADPDPVDLPYPARPSKPTGPIREAAWALLPAVALTIVLIWTWRTMHPMPKGQSGAVHGSPSAPTSFATGGSITGT
jgi:hypothetical protein